MNAKPNKAPKPKAPPAPPKPRHSCGHGPCLAEPCNACQKKEARQRVKDRNKQLAGRRLPDKSTLTAAYDAEQIQWTGSLQSADITVQAQTNNLNFLFALLLMKMNRESSDESATSTNGTVVN